MFEHLCNYGIQCSEKRSHSSPSNETPKENRTDLWLSMIFYFDCTFAVYVGVLCGLFKPKQSCICFADKNEVVMGLFCRNNKIIIMNIEQVFWNIRTIELNVVFVHIDLLSWLFLKWWLCRFNTFWKELYKRHLFLILSIFWHYPSPSP